MRERVFGIETEYALIYHPGRAETLRPTNLQLYGLFETALAGRVRSLPRALSLLRAKSGRFLENGMSFHYEATPEHYEHGLLEVASPECRDPFTLLHYERAKDELVEALCEDVNRTLRLSGLRGEVRVGKNNVDSRGHTFGSHENYWVEDPLSGAERARLLLLWIPLWLVTLPVLFWVLILTPGLFVLSLLALLLYGVAALGAAALGAGLGRLRPAWGEAVRHRVQGLHERVVEGARSLVAQPGRLVRRLNLLVAPLFPALELHSRLLRRFTLQRIQRDFTAFLVTRTVFTGAGAVSFDGGPLVHLAQRPPFLHSLARIFTSGERRPVYEIRDLFFQPMGILTRRRRLHLMIGDANLCEWAQVLRVGVSALVLEAIESGAPVAWPRLEDPLSALRALDRDPELREQLDLSDGGSRTALEIQRGYLAGVRTVLFGQGAALPEWKQRVFRDWQTTLDLLERDPGALADRVDWIAKRSLLESEIPDPGDREQLRRHGGRLVAGPRPEDAEARRLRDLAFRARRLDLRYHELGPRGGHRRLAERGRVLRLSDESAVARAGREAPADTRARRRGQAIREACTHARPGAATWHRVRLGSLDWRFFPDPLDPGGG